MRPNLSPTQSTTPPSTKTHPRDTHMYCIFTICDGYPKWTTANRCCVMRAGYTMMRMASATLRVRSGVVKLYAQKATIANSELRYTRLFDGWDNKWIGLICARKSTIYLILGNFFHRHDCDSFVNLWFCLSVALGAIHLNANRKSLNGIIYSVRLFCWKWS